MQTSNPPPPMSEQEIFEVAAKLPVAGRAACLDAACEGRPDVRAAVEHLLASLDDDAFMRRPADRTAMQHHSTEMARFTPEAVGDQIGNYTLRERIGEGGFGAVWVAEQEKPVRRRVALKIIKPGMDTKEVIARFEQERQALAMMDHPNIAKVLDAGATSFGRPYFVMELVRGVKITKYCDQANLPTAARLKLFTAVCHAVQHAHQKGIIHRDLKPSNILVTLHDGVPVPKVIDFGVAKATQQQRLTDLTIYTQFEQMIGTPLYMSPEQAEMSGLDIDTRSDIYSLGVLLYELLVGHTPFDPETLMKAGFDEMRRVIREQEPQRPSTFVGTMSFDLRTDLAKHRQTDSAKLVGQIRGDLDWIVMKALEKDRSRRYETANGLAQDIQRHLQNEPVQARPPTMGYRFRRMVRRNKLAFAAGSAVFAALLIGLGVSMWMFFKEKDARERAVAAETAQSEERKKTEAEASKKEQVAQFLKDMLAGVGPSVALGRDTAMLREILDKTAERVGNDLKDQPEVEAELRSLLGEVYEALGEYDKAEVMFTKALATFRKLFSGDNMAVANSLHKLAKVTGERGRPVEAEAMEREALAMTRRLFGDEHELVASGLETLTFLLLLQFRLDEAETSGREALALRRKLPGDSDLIAKSLTILAGTLYGKAHLVEAETMLREALAITRKRFGDEHPRVAEVLCELGLPVAFANRTAEAETLYREALAMGRKQLGNEHPTVAAALFRLGGLLHKQGQLLEAEAMISEAVNIRRKVFGDHPGMARCLLTLAQVFLSQGKLSEAETGLREALAILKKNPGNNPSDITYCLHSLGDVLVKRDKLPEAESVFREELAMWRDRLDTPEGLAFWRRQWDLGQYRKDIGVVSSLANVLRRLGKVREEEVFLSQELANVKKRFGSEDRGVATLLHKRAHFLEMNGDKSQAELQFREALDILRKIQGSEHADVGSDAACFARFLLAAKEFAKAEPVARECLTILEGKLPDDWQTFDARSMLGGSLLGQEKYAEAEPLLLSAYEGMKQREDKISTANRARLKESIERLVQLYDATKQSRQAAEWQGKLGDFDKAEFGKNAEEEAKPETEGKDDSPGK